MYFAMNVGRAKCRTRIPYVPDFLPQPGKRMGTAVNIGAIALVLSYNDDVKAVPVFPEAQTN